MLADCLSHQKPWLTCTRNPHAGCRPRVWGQGVAGGNHGVRSRLDQRQRMVAEGSCKLVNPDARRPGP